MYDSVYFFMWPGWRNELESNRWHWSKRWAARAPVVLIQPEYDVGQPSCVVAESRLQNVEILYVARSGFPRGQWFARGLRQSAQIADHMDLRGHEHPLFWCYNFHLAVPYALLPGSFRVYHGTENYFHFPRFEESLDLYRWSIEASDVAVCCSPGVLNSFSRETHQDRLLLIPNGCEYEKYSRPKPAIGAWSSVMDEWCSPGRRLAVFAGNINSRVDFVLVEELISGLQDVGFVFAGPVDRLNLSKAQASVWSRTEKAKNVLVLGRIPAEDLPALYARCDVGIIPYVSDDPLIVENGFPLKALEMAASGLPVVSTPMKPLCGLSPAVEVMRDCKSFKEAVFTQSRVLRSEVDRERVRQVCQAYDYDTLFERMLDSLRPVIESSVVRPADISKFCERLGAEAYRSGLRQMYPALVPASEGVRALEARLFRAVRDIAERIPARHREKIPKVVRSRLRALLK